MKALILITTLLFTQISLAENCSTKKETTTENIVYEVNSKMPKHLKGAKITVTLENGETSTVPAEKFMVVPRKQHTMVGQNERTVLRVTCDSDTKKNLLMVEARKDITEIEVETSGSTTTVSSRKELIPGVDYYRRKLLDTPIGAGLGVDTNGTVKGMLGVEF